MSPASQAGGRAGIAMRIACCFMPFAAGYLMSYLLRGTNAVIAPQLSAEFGLTAADIGVLTSAYFAAFAAAQIPLGVLLDRFGPRRVNAGLFAIAAAGALVYARAVSVETLALGRALIGLGVCGGLMSGFKANTLYWPPERLVLANGILLAAGGAGAAFATLPLQAILASIAWRDAMAGLAAIALCVSAFVFLAAPERGGGGELSLPEQLAGVRRAFSAPLFWRIMPVTVLTHGMFLAYQSLWAAPWLEQVAGLGASPRAAILLVISCTIIAGHLLGGVAVEPLLRRGYAKERILAAFAIAFIAAELPLALGATLALPLTWFLFALFGCATIFAYTILTQGFPASMAGRVNTALNLSVFSGAFALQASVGWAIDLVSSATGWSAGESHRAVIAGLMALQSLALAWYWPVTRKPAGAP
ncbi:MAG: MFS transporter [Alphaproteobacteria bacterium]|nr:MFS transporter [Alphaproteobacteria bacterium]